MTTNSKQGGIQETGDPVVDALLKELIDTGSHPKAAAQAQEIVTAASAQALTMAVARTISHASPFERAFIVATLAPALAEALAPALAEALAPALVKALNEIASAKQPGPPSPSSEGSGEQQGGETSPR